MALPKPCLDCGRRIINRTRFQVYCHRCHTKRNSGHFKKWVRGVDVNHLYYNYTIVPANYLAYKIVEFSLKELQFIRKAEKMQRQAQEMIIKKMRSKKK